MIHFSFLRQTYITVRNKTFWCKPTDSRFSQALILWVPTGNGFFVNPIMLYTTEVQQNDRRSNWFIWELPLLSSRDTEDKMLSSNQLHTNILSNHALQTRTPVKNDFMMHIYDFQASPFHPLFINFMTYSCEKRTSTKADDWGHTWGVFKCQIEFEEIWMWQKKEKRLFILQSIELSVMPMLQRYFRFLTSREQSNIWHLKTNTTADVWHHGWMDRDRAWRTQNELKRDWQWPAGLLRPRQTLKNPSTSLYQPSCFHEQHLNLHWVVSDSPQDITQWRVWLQNLHKNP